jgi:chloramphenicol-sensitive protein RarD
MVILVAFLWIVRKQSPRALLVATRANQVHLVAGLLLGLNWLVFVYAVATERVVEVSLGYFINPLMSVFLGVVFLGERLSRIGWFAICTAALGVVVLGFEAGSLPWISLVLASSFAVYGLTKKQSTRGPIEGLAMETIWIVPFAVAYLGWIALSGGSDGGGSLGGGSVSGSVSGISWGEGSVPVFAALIGLATAAPLLLFARAAQSIPLWAIGLMQYMAPSIQFAIGVFVFGETANPTRLVGFAIIWIGLAVFALENIQKVRTRLGAVS